MRYPILLLPETIEFASETIPHPISDWNDINLSALIVYPFSAPEKGPLVLRLLRFSFEIEVGLDALTVLAKAPITVPLSCHIRES